ncbi:type II toxin-antitoxin system RelE/ParE family toxin [Vreelandella massiliensis]|uniref:type II toxin-antitoxin system RelE/ParE family toxin n=1 Tax=Vreelandella massiliensis TaxID=1816686 RepID=UPI00096A9B2A|nr:type II toxin-antitoxin system RelE/ParE family toxin [Halomonas massiliensis]
MWEVKQTALFEQWFKELDETDRRKATVGLLLLESQGPHLPRPYADTVNDSKHANMKELRIQSQGKPLRAFFAFDPERTGILLCAGDKGKNDKRFYQEMIPIADGEYDKHLETLK